MEAIACTACTAVNSYLLTTASVALYILFFSRYLSILSNLCRYFSGLIVGCLQGVDKDTLLSPRFSPVGPDYFKEHPMVCGVMMDVK